MTDKRAFIITIVLDSNGFLYLSHLIFDDAQISAGVGLIHVQSQSFAL